MLEIKKQTVRAALLGALACCAVLGAAYFWSVHDYQRTVAAMTFQEPELAAIPDGTYTGTCDVRFIRASVAVTVRNGRIERIDLLEHKNGHGQPAEAVLDEITAEQQVDVDAVTGATNSSSVLKKAVENALESAVPQ